MKLPNRFCVKLTAMSAESSVAQRLLVLVGLHGSGKTTLADALSQNGWAVVNDVRILSFLRPSFCHHSPSTLANQTLGIRAALRTHTSERPCSHTCADYSLTAIRRIARCTVDP